MPSENTQPDKSTRHAQTLSPSAISHGSDGHAAPDAHQEAKPTASTGKSGKPLLMSSRLELNETQELIRIVSNRLFAALFTLMLITICGGYLVWSGHSLSTGATNWMVILCGAIGGFISLQRRLKHFPSEDLLLLARSWVYVLLSPLVGGILALLLYFLFLSGLLEGDLFPNFDTIDALKQTAAAAITTSTEATAVNSTVANTLNLNNAIVPGTVNSDVSRTGLTVLFQAQGVGYKDYAKLVFWCFVAGYSESFVTNIISHFETAADSSTSGK